MSRPSEEELTPWFDGKKYKPARPGVYMLKDGIGKKDGYQLYDHMGWHDWCKTASGAAKGHSMASGNHQNDDWRGLKSQPKGK